MWVLTNDNATLVNISTETAKQVSLAGGAIVSVGLGGSTTVLYQGDNAEGVWNHLGGTLLREFGAVRVAEIAEYVNSQEGLDEGEQVVYSERVPDGEVDFTEDLEE